MRILGLCANKGLSRVFFELGITHMNKFGYERCTHRWKKLLIHQIAFRENTIMAKHQICFLKYLKAFKQNRLLNSRQSLYSHYFECICVRTGGDSKKANNYE